MRFISFVITGFVAIWFCRSESPSVLAKALADDANELVMSNSDIRQVLEHAKNCERAVVYINTRWSLTSVDALKTYTQLVMDYHQGRPDDDLLFHIIDATAIDHKQFSGLPGWDALEANVGRRLGIQGAGELLWLNHGTVVSMRSIRETSTLSEFNASTDIVFGN